MSEHEMAEDLRERLTALVADRPAQPSPAPLVITKVRRSRRRAVVGAAALVAALVSGVFVALPHSGTPQPAAPPKLCEVPLPAAWSRALADPKNVSHEGTLLAVSADGAARYVQEGNRILQLSGAAERRVVLSLPAPPPLAKATGWDVSGQLQGDWFSFVLSPHHSNSWIGYLGFYAWNVRSGELRTLLQAGPSPTRMLLTWSVGDGLLSWDEVPFQTNGTVTDGTTLHLVENLADGHRTSMAQSALALVGGLALGTDDHGRLTAVSARTGARAELPAALRAAFRPENGSLSSISRHGVFAWSTRQTTVTVDHGAQLGMGHQDWQLWWQGAAAAVQLPSTRAQLDAGGDPIGDDYVISSTGTLHAGKPYLTDQRYFLVDLRSHAYASLPLDAVADGPAFAAQLGDAPHVLDLDALPRLPGC